MCVTNATNLAFEANEHSAVKKELNVGQYTTKRPHDCDRYLKEVMEKVMEVQHGISLCETERSHLSKNLTFTKKSVQESLTKHVETLRCRAKWLICHADSIYHLKDGSLSQQAAELEFALNDLKSCLDASACSLNSNEDMKNMAKALLKNVAALNIQPCENSLMSFSADRTKLEEAIISFGDIETFDQADDYDVLADEEGIVVIEDESMVNTSLEESICLESVAVESDEIQEEESESSDEEKAVICEPEDSQVQSVAVDEISEGVSNEVKFNTDFTQSKNLNHIISISSSPTSEFLRVKQVRFEIPTSSVPSVEVPSDQNSSKSANCVDEAVEILKASYEQYLRAEEKNNLLDNSFTKKENEVNGRCSPAMAKSIAHLNKIISTEAKHFIRAQTASPVERTLDLHNATMESNDAIINRSSVSTTALKGPVPSNQVENHPLMIPNPISATTVDEKEDSYLNEPIPNSRAELGTSEMITNMTDVKLYDNPLEEHSIPTEEKPGNGTSSEEKPGNGTSPHQFIKSTNAVKHMQELESLSDTHFLRKERTGSSNQLDLCKWIRKDSSCTQCSNSTLCKVAIW